ncbi:alpha-ketoacid dehydrogenase subunit alpha/beta [Simkania negevensis]|uniref:3-methyl-2-oxobutanoate dehydrogenase (2-methylpropanoyl-transferring) n=1 Tax=Simkania negevensis (strain ATCC VR-1471 / DSM 27360 / Z) TaxID=331113 RepID=F8L6S6_SIMNZ|nr:thiamine pyrophosphate-dependent enzyme [Simkania negevensis]CCB88424.1 2-oxoisovalerate dehydrogenase subunit beta [Simkania negevensis Z]
MMQGLEVKNRLQELLAIAEEKSLKDLCFDTLQTMMRCRYVDDKMQKLVRQNKGGTFHLCANGHEMIGALSALSLKPGKDWGLPYYRDRAFALGLGCTLEEVLGAFLAREVDHHSGGRMMPEHFSHKTLRIPCQSSVVGSQFLQAVGVAKAARLADTDEVVYVSAGDGATSQGDFHEALNYACIHKLSVIFVIQDNGWAISVPVEEQTAGGSIVHMARGYVGLTVHDVDGCDFEQVSKALDASVRKGREGLGPSLIVAKIPRLGAHSSSDDPKKYKTDAHFEEETKRDPLPRFEAWLIDHGILSPEEIERLRDNVKEEIETAAVTADQIPIQDPDRVLDHIYKPTPVTLHEEKEKRGEAVVIMDALNHALDEEMERDEGVIIFGQDVAHGKGGVFGITRGLTEKYGVDRCFNTPLAESTIVGTAIGLSVYGNFKPVAEVQFCDYLWTGINQLFNELASYHYRSNGEWNCPVVLRTPTGGYIQGGPYHSQNIEAFLAHCPGLKVVMPSNAADAKMLLKSAIRDPNPVVFLEHKGLYRQRVFCAQSEPTKDEILPLGKAKVVREGSDVTVICYGMMVHMCYEIAQQLEEIDVEIIDLRTLSPLDFETILTSVEKTGKALIVHEAPLTCGFGAEIAAQIAEKGFEFLDAPVKRLGSLDTCVPYCKELEDRVLPQKTDIQAAIRSLASY